MPHQAALARLCADPGVRYDEFSLVVADDQTAISEMIQRLVAQRLGCTVHISSSGNQTLELLSTIPCNVLITDMVMPEPCGLELVAKVRASYPETDIVVMTGYAADFPYVEAIRAGACDFLNKPFSPGELEAKLIRIFNEQMTRHARARAESMYRSLFDLSLDGMLVVSYDNHIVIDVNHAFSELSGLSSEALIGSSIFDLTGETERLKMWLQFCETGGCGTMADLRVKHSSGKQLAADVSVTFVQAEMEKLLFLAFRDVTEKREVERQLADAAQKDTLTGLYNKRTFQNRIEWAISRSREKGVPVCLMMVDLDNFKRCNDTYGHQVGDEVLSKIGRVIEKSTRIATDEGFRLGGDEFAVILLGATQDSSAVVARRMQEEFRTHEMYGTSMSIGVVEFFEEDTAETLIKRADEALYAAKHAGKDTFVIR